ncbi:PaaI family thioesterase [Cohnella nanjingensis]|uniref:PaaI family thioesterase n=1 Tax=Cohnella nanjingensis TaxID=1387779 RepID=A0A7X0RLM0_9BACL|nr:PaaI family thioesterase [Cohnella nanjingensis]MBB6669768.1 PaaI family thioesterase [Cohnella nanjingensis]
MDTARMQEQFERMAEKARHSFWGYVGCEIERIDERQVVVSLDVKEHHLNLIGILHGGVHATLLDSAMGLVAMMARPDVDVVTSNLNLHFTAPAGLGPVAAVAEIAHLSGRMITTQGRLTRPDGTLCAMATASFRVIERKGP